MTSGKPNQGFIAAVSIDQIKDKQVYCTELDGVSIAIGKFKQSFYAVENLCTHAASTFDGGRVKSCFIVCPLHGVMFDLRTGQPKGTMAKKPLRVFATRVNQDSVLEVNLGDSS